MKWLPLVYIIPPLVTMAWLHWRELDGTRRPK